MDIEFHLTVICKDSQPTDMGIEKAAFKFSGCSNNYGRVSVYVLYMIALCYFKWINSAHRADSMLVDVNWQHFLMVSVTRS